MKTDELINQLTSELKPVKPRISPLAFTGVFSLAALIVALLGALAIHFRVDWMDKLHDGLFVFDLMSSLAIVVSSLLVASWLSSPGRGNGGAKQILCFSIVALTLAVSIGRAVSLDHEAIMAGLNPVGFKCFVTVLVLSLIPWGALAFFTSRRAPLRPNIVSISVTLAGLGAGLIGITLHCPVDNGAHIATFHFIMPIIVAFIVALSVLPKKMKW